MSALTDTEYRGNWIRLIKQEDRGLYLAGIQITDDAPTSTARRWDKVAPEMEIHFDFESASEDALIQAKAYIDGELTTAIPVAQIA